MTIQFILITPAPRFYFLMKDVGIYTRSCALVCFFNPSSSSRVEEEKWGWNLNGATYDSREAFLLPDLSLYAHTPPRPFSDFGMALCELQPYVYTVCIWRKQAGQGHVEAQSPSGFVLHTTAPCTPCLLDLLIWIRWRCCLLFVGSKKQINSVQIFKAAFYFSSLNL